MKKFLLLALVAFAMFACRVFAQDLEEIRQEVAAKGGEIICVSHEFIGTGSDKDGSWEAGKFFNGRLLVDADKKVYKEVLGRKGLMSGFGLFSMSKRRRQQMKERKVPGNFSGDGFQLGGVFVIDTDGSVLLSHLQEFFGDDPANEELLAALDKSKALTKA